MLEVNTLWAIQVGQDRGLRPGSAIAWIAAAVFVPCIIRGVWLERRSSIAIACVLYTGLVMAWAFPPVRFLVPILPLLVWFLFAGAGPLRPAVGVLAAVFVATSSIAHDVAAGASNPIKSRRHVVRRRWRRLTRRGISELDRWARRGNTPPDAVLIATHDPTGYLLTGRTALRPDSMDPLMLYYNVRGAAGRTPMLSTWAYRERVLRINADYVVITPRDSIDTLDRTVRHVFPAASRSSRAT